MRELTIAASAVGALMELAVSKGASRAALSERSRIEPVDLVERDNRIPFGKYVALMRAGQELCDDPALGLHFGEMVDVAEMSAACTMGGVTTIDEAFAQANRYSRLGVEVEGVGAGDRFQLKRAGGHLWIIDARGNPNEFPELTESTFARMVCSTRRSLGDTPFFKAVHVTHAAPPYAAEYDRVFRVPIVFASDKNALRVDEALLSNYRIPPAPRYVTSVMRDHAESLLARLDASQSVRGRVEDVLTPILQAGDLRAGAVAATLGLSRQTLFRKLRAEGVTFERVLDELRHRTALCCLDTRNLSVKQSARLVGYSDPAAFSRAFKRWTGASPRAYASRTETSA